MTSLSDIFNTRTQTTTPQFSANMLQFPNGGGTYASPVVAQPKKQVIVAKVSAKSSPIFAPARSSSIVLPPASGVTESNIPPEYIRPDGGYYTAKEVVENRAKKINTPVNAIPKFAGDTLTEAPQSKEQLQATASGLNNARNDIATGETDPYKAASKSGVAYSPEELKAIEKAYAGVYDPAINTALAKLDTKQKEDAAALAAKNRRDEIVFNTNENIRQYKATTGLNRDGSDATFTNTQLNKGASNAGLDTTSFKALNTDVKNFFINPPKGIDPDSNKSVPLYDIFRAALNEVKTGVSDADEITQEIMDSNLPETVKHYFIDQMPIAPAKKQGYFEKLWGAIKGK